jgi:hypothetical protein
VTELFTDLPHDRPGITVGLWGRRAVMTLFALVALLGLLDAFGQRTSSSDAAGSAVRMRLTAPKAVRGGLFFQSRVEIRALSAIDHPRLVLGDGWVEGMQFNSTEPAPETEVNRDGHVVFTYGGLKAGDLLRIWLQFEVDPTNVGRHSYGLELDDAEQPLARISRTLTVLP